MTEIPDGILRLALDMYADEPCRICGKLIAFEDIVDGAVFAGYSADNKSRSAHRQCWDGAAAVFGDVLAENRALIEERQAVNKLLDSLGEIARGDTLHERVTAMLTHYINQISVSIASRSS